MTIGELLHDASVRLIKKGVDSPDLDAEVILCHVLKKTRSWILAHPELRITPAKKKAYADFISRRKKRIPVAYLIGTKEFYGRTFEVTSEVLIPRPDTETCIDVAKEILLRNQHYSSLIDVGTGSGALAITLACEVPRISMTASDNSKPALKIARKNARKLLEHGRIRFFHTDFFPKKEKYDLIIANLPYLSLKEYRAALKRFPELAYEPIGALVAKKNGLEEIERMLKKSPQHLKKGGSVILEIGSEQSLLVHRIAQRLFPHGAISFTRDCGGFYRVCTITPV